MDREGKSSKGWPGSDHPMQGLEGHSRGFDSYPEMSSVSPFLPRLLMGVTAYGQAHRAHGNRNHLYRASTTSHAPCWGHTSSPFFLSYPPKESVFFDSNRTVEKIEAHKG